MKKTENKASRRKKVIVSTVFSMLAAFAMLLFGLLTSSWWLVRIAVFVIGGIPSFIKVV